MTLSERIEDMIAKASPATFEPLDFLNEAKKLFRTAYGEGGEYDAVGENYRDIQSDIFNAADFLYANGFLWAAEQLLVEWWNDVGIRQCGEERHIYRANSAYKLTQIYIREKDWGAAVRWALLTQADDVLDQHERGGGAGKQWLRSVLGMTEAELVAFSRIAEGNLQAARDNGNGLLKMEWFAEDVVVRLASMETAFEHLFSRPSAVKEFPISPGYFRVLLSNVDSRHHLTTKQKGDALEALAAYLFLLIPGWVPRRNVLDQQQGFETDIIVSNLNPASNLGSDLLGRYFLVECKNWSNAVGVSQVGYFLYRMHLTHCNFGVVFAKDNITGSSAGEEKAARSLIRRAFHEDGSTCIVLDQNHLESLAQGTSSFWPLLLREIERFRFGKAKRG